jgi:hypothetical protein
VQKYQCPEGHRTRTIEEGEWYEAIEDSRTKEILVSANTVVEVTDKARTAALKRAIRLICYGAVHVHHRSQARWEAIVAEAGGPPHSVSFSEIEIRKSEDKNEAPVHFSDSEIDRVIDQWARGSKVSVRLCLSAHWSAFDLLHATSQEKSSALEAGRVAAAAERLRAKNEKNAAKEAAKGAAKVSAYLCTCCFEFT